jgi:cell division protein FtsB
MIFFSKNGILDYTQLKKQESEISAQAVQAEKENQKIEKEIKSLKHDINYIKHLAKHEQEMAEPGELIFKDEFKDKSEKKENTP